MTQLPGGPEQSIEQRLTDTKGSNMGVVTDVRSRDTETDGEVVSNHEVDVKLRSGEKKPNLPVHVNRIGEARVPAVGDFVEVSYLSGASSTGYISGFAYSDEQRAPLAREGHWRQRFGSGEFNMFLESEPKDHSGVDKDFDTNLKRNPEEVLRLAAKTNGLADPHAKIELDTSGDAPVLRTVGPDDEGLTVDANNGSFTLANDNGYGIESIPTHKDTVTIGDTNVDTEFITRPILSLPGPSFTIDFDSDTLDTFSLKDINQNGVLHSDNEFYVTNVTDPFSNPMLLVDFNTKNFGLRNNENIGIRSTFSRQELDIGAQETITPPNNVIAIDNFDTVYNEDFDGGISLEQRQTFAMDFDAREFFLQDNETHGLVKDNDEIILGQLDFGTAQIADYDSDWGRVKLYSGRAELLNDIDRGFYTEYDPSLSDTDFVAVGEEFPTTAQLYLDYGASTPTFRLQGESGYGIDSDGNGIVTISNVNPNDSKSMGIEFNFNDGSFKIVDGNGYGIESDGDGSFTWYSRDITHVQDTNGGPLSL